MLDQEIINLAIREIGLSDAITVAVERSIIKGYDQIRLIARLSVNGKRLIIRIISLDQDGIDAVKQRVSWQKDLYNSGFIVPKVYSEDCIECNGVPLYIVTEEELIDRMPESKDICQMANLLAKLHDWSKHHEFINQPLWDVEIFREEIIMKHAKEFPIPYRSVQRLQKEIYELRSLSRKEKRGWVHGDYGPGNACITAKGPGLYDFERSGFGTYTVETAISSVVFSQELKEVTDSASIRQSFLETYYESTNTTEEERKYIGRLSSIIHAIRVVARKSISREEAEIVLEDCLSSLSC